MWPGSLTLSRGDAMTLGMDFTSQDFFRDPAAGLKRLRAAGAVVEVRLPIIGRVWMTTTQEMASRVLQESQVFTLRKDDGAVAGLHWWMPRLFFRVHTNNMLAVDEPDHTRLRGIVDESFSRRAVLDMEPRIRAIADELAGDLFARGSPADLVTRYARMLPLSVICELLGLPLADRPKFMAWADRVSGVASSALGLLRVVPSLAAMKRYLERHLEYARKVGGEGLIAELVRAEKEGARLSRNEMVPMVYFLLVAGHESTTHLISGSVFELAKNPGLRDWLAEDWSRADLALEEFLRFVSPVHFSKPRFVRQDMDLDGARLKSGDQIMAMLVAANMDPAANVLPEKLDLERRPNRHISFGTGIHFCLGHQLARLEGKCALEALYTRWPKLELAVDPAQIQWRSRPGFSAITSLPVVATRNDR
jgi:cytochrome P450